MTVVRLGLAVLWAALVLVGCASLSSSAPFSRAQSCQAVGGIYRADGSCGAGLP
jgi:hypothetical protein